MGIIDIIGLCILVAVVLGFCFCCTKVCQRKRNPENRRKRRRRQKNARRKRRRQQQRNCPSPQSVLNIVTNANSAPQQQRNCPAPQSVLNIVTNANSVPQQQRNCPASQSVLNVVTNAPLSNSVPQQPRNTSGAPLIAGPDFSQTFPHQQLQIQQFPHFSPQPFQTQQYSFAQQQVPHMNVPSQQGELYSFPPPPYEPPQYQPSQGQFETRIAMPSLVEDPFSLPPPPPYDFNQLNSSQSK